MLTYQQKYAIVFSDRKSKYIIQVIFVTIPRFINFRLYFETVLKNVHHIEAHYLEPYGLRSAHTVFLLTAGSISGGMTMTEISRRCYVDKALTSRMMRELIDGGFIKKVDNAGVYKALYAPTEKGKAVIMKLDKIIAKCIADTSGNISREDLATFYSVLSHINGRIGKIAAKV